MSFAHLNFTPTGKAKDDNNYQYDDDDDDDSVGSDNDNGHGNERSRHKPKRKQPDDNNNNNKDDLDDIRYTQTTCKQDFEKHLSKKQKFQATIHPREYIAGLHGTRYDLTDDEVLNEAILFLEQQAEIQPTCLCRTKNKTILACQCFSIFKREHPDNDRPNVVTLAVAKFIIHFSKSTKNEQQAMAVEWIKQGQEFQKAQGTRRQGLYYTMPVLCNDDGDGDDPPVPLQYRDRKICMHSMLTIIGRGDRFWKTCRIAAKKGTVPKHALVGRSHHWMYGSELYECICYFLDSAIEEAPAVYNPQNGGTWVLPHDWSKKNLFMRFCFDRGWKTTSPDFTRKVEQEERTDEDHVKGTALQVGAYALWIRLWNKYYPNVFVGKLPSRKLRAKKSEDSNSEDDNDEEDNDEEDNDEEDNDEEDNDEGDNEEGDNDEGDNDEGDNDEGDNDGNSSSNDDNGNATDESENGNDPLALEDAGTEEDQV